MKHSSTLKLSLVAVTLTLSSTAHSVPVLGGLYDWWAGHVVFTDGSSRLAQGGSFYSCTQDLITQRNHVASYGKTFSHYIQCTKSAYPKFYQLPMLVHQDDNGNGNGNGGVLDELEKEYKIDTYRAKVTELMVEYEQEKQKGLEAYQEKKGSRELSQDEMEYVDMMASLPVERAVAELDQAFRISEFKEKTALLRE